MKSGHIYSIYSYHFGFCSQIFKHISNSIRFKISNSLYSIWCNAFRLIRIPNAIHKFNYNFDRSEGVHKRNGSNEMIDIDVKTLVIECADVIYEIQADFIWK